MKNLFKCLLLTTLFSFNVYAENPPPANAFIGTMYGYEVAVFQKTDDMSGLVGIKAIYKSDGSWVYLLHPTVNPFDGSLDTKASTDASFALMIDEINDKAYEVLRPISLEPDKGEDRLQWLIENKLDVVDDRLVIK